MYNIYEMDYATYSTEDLSIDIFHDLLADFDLTQHLTVWHWLRILSPRVSTCM